MTNSTIISNKPSITIAIEDVTIAEEYLAEKEANNIVLKNGTNVKAISPLPERLVDMGTHAFIAGLYKSYSEHRPFVISPEMLWMLIQQGLSMHLYHNKIDLIALYPHLKTVKTLEVELEDMPKDLEDWRSIVTGFVTEMETYIDKAFITHFKCDFSHSTADESTAGDLMLMDAMQPYFEYIAFYAVCGIPKMTIEGSQSDWMQLLEKLDHFESLGLDWWFKKLRPILKEIINTLNGAIDQTFWMNMFKVHTKDAYGAPKLIDGWITNFFPYSKKGKRLIGEALVGLNVDVIFETLPSEISKIPFKLQMRLPNGGVIKETEMEFSAGFIGLSQDSDTKSLRPEIGWFVGDATSKVPQKEAYQDMRPESREYFSLDAFPMAILNDGIEFEELRLNFKNEINYPENIADIKVIMLSLFGHEPEGLREDLQQKFKHTKTRIIINNDWDHPINTD